MGFTISAGAVDSGTREVVMISGFGTTGGWTVIQKGVVIITGFSSII